MRIRPKARVWSDSVSDQFLNALTIRLPIFLTFTTASRSSCRSG